MAPSRTALVLQSQGDPIFGAIGRFLAGKVKPIIKSVRTLIGRGRDIVGASTGTSIATRSVGGTLTRARQSKIARVLGEGAVFGGGAAVVGRAVRGIFPGGANVEGQFVFGESGCPTGKVVEVAAHQRIIPLDRFGRPRRRIDVLNTKALARATRRLGGFQKRARRVEKQLARIAPRSRRRSRSKGVC